MSVFKNKETGKMVFVQVNNNNLELSKYDFVRVADMLINTEKGADDNIIEIDFKNRCLAAEAMTDAKALEMAKAEVKVTKTRKLRVRRNKNEIKNTVISCETCGSNFISKYGDEKHCSKKCKKHASSNDAA